MRILLLVLSLCYCLQGYADTYYISPTGNDTTGDGSLANPWASLRKATDTITNPGDTIRVLPGLYYETQECFLAPGVNILGSGVGTSVIYSIQTGYFSTLLTLASPDSTNGNQFVTGLTLDGGYVNDSVYKTWVGIWVTGRSNVTIQLCYIANFKNRGVIFDGNNLTEPGNDSGHHATGNIFYGNSIFNSAENNGAYGAGLLNIGAQQGMIISNNTLIQNQRPDFKNGWPIKYWDNGWLKGVIIHSNTLIKSPFMGIFPGQGGDWDFAIELFNIKGLEIYNNYIEGSIDLNYNYKGDYNHSAWIHHNTITHPVQNLRYESGVIFEFRTESALVEKNLFNNISGGILFNTRGYNNPGGNDSLPVPPVGGYSYITDNVIRNNVFNHVYQGNGNGAGGGIIFHSESTNDTYINNLKLHYNTIVAQDGDEPWFGIMMMSLQNGMATNIDIRNNIVNGFLETWLRGDSGITNINGMLVAHNNSYDNGFGNGNLPLWPGGLPQNYTDTNNLHVDPLFVSPASLHLQPASPLFGKGTAIAGVTTDIVNNGRNAGPTIGAYEDKVMFSGKIFLQGAYSAALGRHKNVTPAWAAVLNTDALLQPYGPIYGYTGTDSVPAGFFNYNDTNGVASDIVDWVLLELRDPVAPATIKGRKAAFVREDGLIVDTDGISPVGIRGVQAGNYLVSVRHRNHLGVRSSAQQSLNGGNSSPTLYDFTQTQTAAYQDGTITSNAAMAQDGTSFMLWSGNANHDSYVRAVSQAIPPISSDAAYILTLLGGDPNATLNGYSVGDVNIDGYTRVTSQAIPPIPSDVAFILSTALGGNSSATRKEHK